MPILRFNQFPEGSGSLTSDDIFLFMDDPAGSGVTKKISLNDISNAIGGGGGGLSDSNTYIICKTGDDLIAKYAAAKLLTPRGNPLSATNRATLIIMPGNYSLSAELTVDAEFVDILGLGSMKLDRGCVTAVTLLNYTINVTANDVRVKGISVGTQSFKIGNNLPLQIIEDCIGGNNSFGGGNASGSFVNCSGGDSSFGGLSGTANGTFKDCSGGYGSFGGAGGNASGSFVNCSGGDYSFGSEGGNASGSFVNCSGGDYSFGGNYSNASGTFKDCSGGDASFGGDYGTANGTFKDCSGGYGSFGGNGGTASGKFLRCTLTTGTFQTLSGTGKYRLCIDGNYDVINADAP